MKRIGFRSRPLLGVILASCASVALPGFARAEDYVQFGLGADYSKGDYGFADDTEILAVPASIRYKTGNFFVRASLPWLRIEGPGSVVGGDGGPIQGGAPGPVETHSGIGDLALSGGYSLDFSNSLYLDLVGRVKVPTASRKKSLGTGTTDVTTEATLTKQFGMLSLSAKGGRRFNGSNKTFPLRDAWLAGGSLAYQSGKVTLGVDYDWREAFVSGGSPVSELTGSITYKVTPAWRLQLYGYTGFANGSPDAGGGLQLLYRFNLS
jgi:hypothetical protein